MPNFPEVILSPGNSVQAVGLLTEMLERCCQCRTEGCPGLGELLIQVTIQSAVDRCEEEAERKDGLGSIMTPGPSLAEGI